MKKRTSKFIRTLCLCCIVLFMSRQALNSQNEIWEKASNSEKIQLTKETKGKSSIYALKVETLEQKLSSVTTYNSQILAFPLNNGNVLEFLVEETRVMHPDLEKKFPEIRSFRGISLDASGKILVFTYSPKWGLYGVYGSGAHEKQEIKPLGNSLYKFTTTNSKEDDAAFICEIEDYVRPNLFKKRLFDRDVNDGNLRRYRLALSVSGDYSQVFLDGSEADDNERKSKVLQAMTSSINRLNGIFERDFGVTMQLIPNSDALIFLNPATDPYTTGISLRSQLVNTLNNVLSNSDYDVGHLFHKETNRVYGNAGCIACVCTDGQKGQAYSVHGNPETDGMNLLAAHEFGHQFGAYHTQSSANCRSGINSEVEPGSGSTIMSYAGICPPNVQGGSDDYFNYTSIRDVANWTINNSSCAELISTSNSAPVIVEGSNYIIPKSTAFVLDGDATDSDGDNTLTYCWEQNDPENPNSTSTPQQTNLLGPMFRSYPPTTNNKRYFPDLTNILANNLTPTWEVLPSVSRRLNFVLTVRDNDISGGQVSSDAIVIDVEGGAGPFLVTSQRNNSEIWTVGEPVTVSWDVAGTNLSPINTSQVEILLSTDGGSTFSSRLITTDNDGTETFNLPDVEATTNARIMVKAVNNVYFAVNEQEFTIQKSEYAILSGETHIDACSNNSAILNLEYKTFLSFNEEVNISASNLPQGANATFSQDSFNGTNTDGLPFTVTVSGLEGLESGDYTFNVDGLSTTSNVEKSIELSFTLYNENDVVLNLVSPANNSSSQDLEAELSWDGNLNSVSYQLQIATDDLFNNIIDDSVISETSFQSSNLENNQRYYWRVKSFNPCGASDFSPVFNFSTQCIAPINFLTVSTEINRIEVTWEDTSNSNSWVVEYGESGFELGTGITSTTNLKQFIAEGLESGTEYEFYVAGDCSVGGNSSYLGPYKVFTKADYCSGDHFYDSGGAQGNYDDNENITTQIYPDNDTDRVVVRFNTFNIHDGFDYLRVYNGEDDKAVFLGAYTGSELEGLEFASSHESGALTFVFTSNSFLNFSGWDASVTCELKPNCFEPVNFEVTEIKGDEASFSWEAVGNDENWELEYGLEGFILGEGQVLNTSQQSAIIQNLEALTAYDVYVKTACDAGGFSEVVGPIKITTTELCSKSSNLNVTRFNSSEVTVEWQNLNPSVSNWEVEYGAFGFTQGTGISENVSDTTINISELTSNTQYQLYVRANCEANGDGFSEWVGPIDFTTSIDYCNGDHFYDSGGPSGNYSNGENTITTIYPNTSEDRVKVIFNSFLVETCCDRLRIFDGPDTQSPLLGIFVTNPGTLVSSHESGALTFLFTSDGSVTRSGWDATVICESKPNCLAPTNFSYNNLEAKQVDLSWQQPDNTSSWTIEYVITGFVLGEGTEVTSDNVNITLNQLTPETSYDAYLKANCDEEGTSDVVGPLSFTTPVACFIPQNLRLVSVTTTSATVTWDTGESNESQWEIEYGSVGFQLGTGTRESLSTNSASIENLNPNSQYDVYVRANCNSDGYSNWSLVSTFKTNCVALTAPYKESFVLTNSMPDCWEQSDNGNWNFNTYAGYDASNVQDRNTLRNSNYAWLRGSYSPFQGDYVLKSPFVDVSSLSNSSITFSVFSKNTINNIYNTLNVSISDRNGTVYTNIITVNENTHIWKDFVIDLNDYSFTSSEIQVEFRVRLNTNNGRYNDILIDEVAFDELPSCSNPINPIISNVTGKTADFSWESTGNENDWEIQYGFSGFTTSEAITEFTSDNPYTFTNLLPERSYDVYIRAACGIGDSSDFIGPISFTTTELCSKPSNLRFISSTKNTAKLSWDDIENTIDWEVEYHTSFFSPGNGVGVTEVVNTNAVTIENLLPDTAYYVYIRRNCGAENGYSDWVGYTYFRTQIACFQPENLGVSSVTKNQATLFWDENIEAENWEIEYNAGYFTPGNGVGTVVSANTNSLDVENLLPDTRYYFYVRSNCGIEDGYSNWSGYFSFVTPLNCGVPTGFRFTDVTKNSAILEWDNSSDAVEWEIEYHNVFFDPGNGVGTTVTAFTNEVNLENLLPDTWYLAYIRSNCGVDDGYSSWSNYIFFKTPLNCAVPTDFTSSNITVSSATLEWTNNSDANEWEIEYHTSFFSPGNGTGTTITANSNSVNLEQLQSDTWYYAYVRSNCGTDDGYSNWSNYIAFKTEISCNVPKGFQSTGVTKNTATLQWDNNSNSIEWEIEYHTDFFNPGNGIGTTIQAASNSLNLEQLQSDTWYYAYVRSNCGVDDGYSNWSNYIAFKTEVSCNAPTVLWSTNVTKNTATLEWDNSSNSIEWEIEYHTSFFTPGNGVGIVNTVTSNSLNLDDLQPDTLYYAYVRSNCGEDDGYSRWIGYHSFRTQVACIAPTSFRATDVTGAGVTLEWENSNGANEWEIEYHTNFFTPGNGIGTIVSATSNTINLENLSQDTFYYAYVRSNCGEEDGYSNWVGYVTFRTLLLCNVPTNPIVDNITENSASLTWNDDDNALGWEIEYNELPFNPGSGTRVETTENTIDLEDLESGTIYYLYLRKNCGESDGYSNWISLNFTTICSTSSQDNLISNGSFECGSLEPWVISGPNTFSGCAYNFSVLTNSNTVCLLVDQITPTDGNYAAFTSFDGAGGTVYGLKQSIDIPNTIGNADAAILSFDFKVNYQMTFSSPTQERVFEARFTDVNGVQLFQIETITFGINPDTGKIDRSFSSDILSQLRDYAGQTVFIDFLAYIPESSTGPAKALIDNVSLIADGILSNFDVNSKGGISIYPVPNNGEFVIDSKNGGIIQNIEVFDISGRLINKKIVKKTLSKVNVNLINIEAGVYYVIVHVNGISHKKRIMIK